MENKTLSLKKLTISASLWNVVDHAFTQIVRFGSNIILTRLLVPDMFGLMQLVMVFLNGAILFTDSGIRLNVIQNDRTDKTFLRTAWSFEALKGFCIWILSAFFAYPFANFYGYEELTALIPVACLSIFINSCTSTNLYVYQKHLQIRVISLINISATIVATCMMLFFAYYYRSIWALVSFGVIRAGIITLLSHIIPGLKMKVCFNRETLIEILHFSKWIVLSSILGFLALQFDKLFFGKTIAISQLGFYGIAAAISQAVIFFASAFTINVLVPLYKKLLSHDQQEMHNTISKTRYTFISCMLVPLFILIIWGKEICLWIYPESYSEVGNIVKILALGVSFYVVSITITPILLATGKVNRNTALTAVKFVILALCFSTGFMLYGFYGALYGYCIANLFYYPFTVFFTHEFNLWTPIPDIFFFSLCILVGFVGEVIIL